MTCSLNNNRLIPKFQPNRYSQSLSNPMSVTMRLQAWPKSRSGRFAVGMSNISSAAPDRIKATAVVGFIETKPEKTLLKSVTSNVQPVSVRQPTAMIKKLAKNAIRRQEQIGL